MKMIQPTFQIIEPSFGSSFTFSKYVENANSNAHLWHYHPEIELVYVNGGSGKRQVGSHISYYTDGDLILIGSNLPHCGFTNEQTGNKNETVLQMKPNFLGNNFFDVPEMKTINTLFNQAKAGIAFSGETKKRIGEKIEIGYFEVITAEKVAAYIHPGNRVSVIVGFNKKLLMKLEEM